MPTYEYRCPSGHKFERFYRKISDASPGVTCPECGKVAERIMSAGGGLLFKGSGFYLTDYGKNAHRGEAPPKADSGGDSAAPAAAVTGESSSAAKDSGSGAKDSGPKETSSKPSDAKPAATSKPAEGKSSSAKAPSESKPAKSGGSKPAKDK